LLHAIETVLEPLPRWGAAVGLKLPATFPLLTKRDWLHRHGYAGQHPAVKLANYWAGGSCFDSLELSVCTAVALTVQVCVSRMLDRDFASVLSHVASRISTHAFDDSVWQIIDAISKGESGLLQYV